MYKILIFSLSLSLLSCTSSNDKLLNEAYAKLSTTKALKYSVEKLTIEGHLPGDSILSTVNAVFQVLKADTLVGCQYYVENKLIHPRFNVPMTLSYYYDGESLTMNLLSELKNDHRVTAKQNLKVKSLVSNTKGQVPYCLDIIAENGFELVSSQDSVYRGKACVLFKALSKKGIVNELFIERSTAFLAFLRIIENPDQPFIQEYAYNNFEFSDKFEEPVFSVLQESVKEEKLKVGDKLPNWQLASTGGESFTTSEYEGKTTIMFLSAIYCGACQKQIPFVKKVYDKCAEDERINCIVFYPDDKKERLIPYIEHKKISYPITFNPSKDEKQRYQLRKSIVRSYPDVVILNENNEIVWISRESSEEIVDIEKALETALQKVLENECDR